MSLNGNPSTAVFKITGWAARKELREPFGHLLDYADNKTGLLKPYLLNHPGGKPIFED
jgi:hypothetical protein